MAVERSFIVVILFTFSLLTGFDDIKFIFFVADEVFVPEKLSQVNLLFCK